jgi:SAM-dependent methyltransferase
MIKLKTIASKAFQNAELHNRQNILNMCSSNISERLLDIGCNDGTFTIDCGKHCLAKHIAGIEIVVSAAKAAETNGVDVCISDLGNPLPYDDNSFDLIISNQVIEHVPNLDLYLSEIYRVLANRGTAIISTENGSSWVNIISAIFGWQILSLTNMSSLRYGIGNPLALHRGESNIAATWTHKTIFNYRGLIEFSEAHGFEFKKISGAGYFPLSSKFARIDTRHSHFITIEIQKLAETNHSQH